MHFSEMNHSSYPKAHTWTRPLNAFCALVESYESDVICVCSCFIREDRCYKVTATPLRQNTCKTRQTH